MITVNDMIEKPWGHPVGVGEALSLKHDFPYTL